MDLAFPNRYYSPPHILELSLMERIALFIRSYFRHPIASIGLNGTGAIAMHLLQPCQKHP
jgi:hypothetical protein